MKSVSIRFPEEMVEWLRTKAAEETIKRRGKVSINSYVVELVKREMATKKDPERPEPQREFDPLRDF